ncbi:MAG: trypsin-like peptidase domain-containing protein, partial [Firmicutes bacterium]|nr:trypsin-like peptidase domain-containing protein [Bacillota bacterium]
MRRIIVFCLCSMMLLFLNSSAIAKDDLPEIIKKIEPSIIMVLTYDREGKLLGQGSGFFINENGEAITSRHVLEGAVRA